MQNLFSINDLKPNNFYETIECKSNNVKDINYSSILTKLIQEAGRWCESYASDLFITWNTVLEYLKKEDKDEFKRFSFGFRKSGVDHTEFIESRVNSNDKHNLIGFELYRSVYFLDILYNSDENEIYMTLSRYM